MPPKATDESLAGAIIEHVERGAYPESEEVISAELPASAYPRLLANIEGARDEVKADIRALSKGAAPDVDTWIAQAKQLQADIQRSKATARQIVNQAEAGKQLQATAKDAANKASLLKSELAFNESLANTLAQVKSITGQLDNVQAQIAEDRLTESIDELERAVDTTGELTRHENARFTELLHDRIARLGAEAREHAMLSWKHAVVVEKASNTISIHERAQTGPAHSIETTTAALAKLNVQDDAVEQLCASLDALIVRPSLSPKDHSQPLQLVSAGDSITAEQSSTTATAEAKLTESQNVLDFLHAKLPQALFFQLSEKLVPTISSYLINAWLTPAVPLTVDGIDEFQILLNRTAQLSEHIRSLEAFGANSLADWVDEAPRIWLSRRKETALAAIRTTSFKGLDVRKSVERVETQMVPQSQDISSQIQSSESKRDDEDWDEDWGHEEDKPQTPEEAEPDEDTSAWDVNEEGTGGEASTDHQDSNIQTEEDGGEAWGWDDGENMSQPASPVTAKQPKKAAPRTNGIVPTDRPAETEMTLRESYAITGIPDSLMDLIVALIDDADKLSAPRFADSPIAPAARGLYTIPPLVLGMYRATAATYYVKNIAGNMLLYNDCSNLCERLSKLAADSANSGIGRLRLDSDINLLSRFGKLAYGREMESQRTILRDLLDGTQNFTSCTVQPFAAECENAVAMTVDRIRDVKKQWEGILSTSALLQSIGNLVSTVCSKVILDIEEMADISEDESQSLRGYIDKIATLSDLFVQSSPAGDGEQVDMTGVYTPNWFKFQYLGEILESRLADIKYLWQEGELSLEFEVGEVVDLIEALFADSDYRRNAIRDIRASASHC